MESEGNRGKTYFRNTLLEWQLIGCDCVNISHRLILQWEIQTANHRTWNWIVWPFLERGKSEELIWGQMMSLVWNKRYRQNTYVNGSQSVALRQTASASTVNLLDMQSLGPHARPTESETVELRPNNLF